MLVKSLVVVLTVAAMASPARAQSRAKGEVENLVPPGGAAFDVPVHAGEVCILSFPEKLASSALASSSDFEIKAWGDDGVAVRAIGKGGTSTLALATKSGAIKVNVTLRVTQTSEPALTLVRFKAATMEEAFKAAVDAEVAKQVAPIEAAAAAARQAIDTQIRDRADALLLERLLKRAVNVDLNAHERNDDNVIVHVEQAVVVGDDAYLLWRLENRSRGSYRVKDIIVTTHERSTSGKARLNSSAIDVDPAMLGVVPAGTTATGVVAVHGFEKLRGAPLELVVHDATGRGDIRLSRGLGFR
jgi:hypothetical protein